MDLNEAKKLVDSAQAARHAGSYGYQQLLNAAHAILAELERLEQQQKIELRFRKRDGEKRDPERWYAHRYRTSGPDGPYDPHGLSRGDRFYKDVEYADLPDLPEFVVVEPEPEPIPIKGLGYTISKIGENRWDVFHEGFSVTGPTRAEAVRRWNILAREVNGGG